MFILDLEKELELERPMSEYLCGEKVDKELILKVENDPELVKKILTKENKINISWFLKRFGQKLSRKIYEENLIPLLNYRDIYIQFKTCEILTALYEKELPSRQYLVFINQFLKSSCCYMELNQILSFLIKIFNNLDNESIKEEYLEDDHFVKLVSSFVLRRETQYNALLIISILSFGKIVEVCERFSLLERLPTIIAERRKEKVLRVSFNILENLYKTDFRYNTSTTKDLLEKIDEYHPKNNDKELLESKKFVKEKICEQQEKRCSLTSYYDEIFSGELEETKLHFDHRFWEINSEELGIRKADIIKSLKKFLKSSNEIFVKIATNDICMMLKSVPGSHFYVDKYKVKEDLFRLCTHDNIDVKYYAVQALSTCILSEWK